MNQLQAISQTKMVDKQTGWNVVARELESENIKLMSYDETLLGQVKGWQGKKVLDYGAGPGVLAKALQKLGADVRVFDINPEMRQKAADKIGRENVFERVEDIPTHLFDAVICNLVLCIVSEEEVERILSNIRLSLNSGGVCFIGFCNPKIHNVGESQLDFRFFSGQEYEENHNYKKIKKEGLYEIVESHRPVEWYAKIFHACGLVLLDVILTPEYQIRENKINDFTIFKLTKSAV